MCAWGGLPTILTNLRRLMRMRPPGHYPNPELGIAFVAMKRNIADLPKIIKIGRSLRAQHFSISNLQLATEAMQAETLYRRVTNNIAYLPAPHLPRLNLPKMDFDAATRDALMAAFDSGCNVSYAGNNWGGANDTCNVEAGTMSTAGEEVQPVLAADAHPYHLYLHGRRRVVKTARQSAASMREACSTCGWGPALRAYRVNACTTSLLCALYTFAAAAATCSAKATRKTVWATTFSPVCGGCPWCAGRWSMPVTARPIPLWRGMKSPPEPERASRLKPTGCQPVRRDFTLPMQGVITNAPESGWIAPCRFARFARPGFPPLPADLSFMALLSGWMTPGRRSSNLLRRSPIPTTADLCHCGGRAYRLVDGLVPQNRRDPGMGCQSCWSGEIARPALPAGATAASASASADARLRERIGALAAGDKAPPGGARLATAIWTRWKPTCSAGASPVQTGPRSGEARTWRPSRIRCRNLRQAVERRAAGGRAESDRPGGRTGAGAGQLSSTISGAKRISTATWRWSTRRRWPRGCAPPRCGWACGFAEQTPVLSGCAPNGRASACLPAGRGMLAARGGAGDQCFSAAAPQLWLSLRQCGLITSWLTEPLSAAQWQVGRAGTGAMRRGRFRQPVSLLPPHGRMGAFCGAATDAIFIYRLNGQVGCAVSRPADAVVWAGWRSISSRRFPALRGIGFHGRPGRGD